MIYAIIAVLVLIADQWMKYWVTVNITLETGSQALIPGVIKLVNIHNPGAAFGMLDNVPFARWVLLGLAAVMCIAIIVLIAKKVFPSKFATWCMVLFMAGALGNCIDRSIYGYVVDMFKLEFVSFAVFNVADVFLTVSCLLFIIYLFVGGKDEDKLSEAMDNEPVKKSGHKKAADENGSAGYTSASYDDDDVWNSFKAALQSSDDEKEPEPEIKLPHTRKSALDQGSKPKITEEPLPEPKAEVSPAENLADIDEMNPTTAPAQEIGADNFSLEDILREFGS